MTGPSASQPGGDSAGGPGFGGPGPADSATDSGATGQPVADTDADVVDAVVVPDDDVGVEPHLVIDAEVVDESERDDGTEPVDETQPIEVDPIAVLTLERDDYRDALVRLQADFENYKKRMIKQQTDHLARAAEALVEKLLPVLDTGDLALAHGAGEDVKQVMGALTGVLEREGLERIDSDGSAFDPTLHDAVAHEPGDGGEQEVAQVLRAGYRWKGRVLRPAMVKVRG